METETFYDNMSSPFTGDSNTTYFTNSLEFQEYHRMPFFNYVGSFVTVLISFTAFAGNLSVISISFWDENLRSQVGNILIVFLACIDVWTSIFVMLPSAIAVAADFWPLGWFTCRANAVFNYMCACSSSYTAAIISLDRAIAVLFPMKYERLVTRKTIIILCAWITINTSGVATFCGSTPWVSYDYNEGMCTLKYSAGGPKLFIQSAAFFCYWVPAIIMIVTNFFIIRQVRKSSKVMFTMVNLRDMNDKRKKDLDMRKSIYSMMAIVCVYFICFTPYAISKQVKSATEQDPPSWFNYTITILIFCSSATNPFIYGILRKDYREGFKKLPRMLKEKFTNCC